MDEFRFHPLPPSGLFSVLFIYGLYYTEWLNSVLDFPQRTKPPLQAEGNNETCQTDVGANSGGTDGLCLRIRKKWFP